MATIGPYELDSLICGDSVELTKSIPDNSVDIIITDPPYLKEYLHLYEWLAEAGKRILKPGGYLFAYGAGEHIPDHLARMGKHLDYFWLFPLIHNGAYPRMWHKKLMSGYKPIMVYTKSKPNRVTWMATVHSAIQDKRFHEWGQGIGFTLKVIDLLTSPGDIVFDPFCGGGMTAYVCQERQRRYLSFDSNPEAIATATRRLSGDQFKFFDLPEQDTMFNLEV